MHLNAPVHTYTYNAALIHMLWEKEPAQTKRPWKFNTPGVQRIHKQTHAQSHGCAQTQTRHRLFLFHSQPLKFHQQDVKWIYFIELFVAPVFLHS